MHNGQVTYLHISWAISKKKVRHGYVHVSNVCADHEPKPLDIRAETGFPPSQTHIQMQARVASQKGAWPAKIEDFSLP